MPYVGGWLYRGGRFVRGSVFVEDGTVVSLSRDVRREAVARGLVLPAFANAHTHLGDAALVAEPRGSLQALVAPPRGLKHRLLATTKDEVLTAGVRDAALRAAAVGTLRVADFREGGLPGVRLLLQGLLDAPLRPLVLGRPAKARYDQRELEALLRVADGIGASAARDWHLDALSKVARHTRRTRKIFSLHASEAEREEIGNILDLHPDFLVHMVEATADDWRRCADEEVPIAVCPSSNLFFGKVPNLPAMARSGATLMLGTDNAWLAQPSMLSELRIAYKVARLHGGLPAKSILEMAWAARKALWGLDSSGVAVGEPAELLVLDVPVTHDPKAYDVLRATEADVAAVAAGDWTYTRFAGWQRPER